MFYSKETERKITFIKGMSASLVITVGVVGYYHFYRLPKLSKIVESKYSATMEKKLGKKITIFQAKDPIIQGTASDGIQATAVQTYSSLVPEDAIKNMSDLDKKCAKLDIKPRTTLTTSMFVNSGDKVTSDLRQVDMKNVRLTGGLKKDMYVDVRFRRKDGKDDVVLSKKKVLNVVDSTVFFNLDEVEINYYNNATVEAGGAATAAQNAANANGELYTTIYVDPQNQPAAAVTYVIKPEIQALIDSNPNAVRSAQEKTKIDIKKVDSSEVKKEN